MHRGFKSIIMIFLMLVLSSSVATNSLNVEVETLTFEEMAEPLNVILPISDLNEPGFQQGSIYTNTTLSAGGVHTCAILDNGSVSCWGAYVVGKGITTSIPTLISSFGANRTAVAISSGYEYACAILDDGSVSCWGDNYAGQLGDGTTTRRYTPTPTSSLGPGRTAVAIGTGSYHTCVILDNGSVSCWGSNWVGQLGDGTTTDRHTPTLISGLGNGRTAVAISVDDSTTCAILDNGLVSCWGSNSAGKLGDGTSTDRHTPTPTSSLGNGRTAVAISSTASSTCAILDNGLISCWGYGGQIGDGTTTNRHTPTPTSSLGTGRTAVSISGGNLFYCALLDNGSVSCWGWSYFGMWGNQEPSNQTSPILISSLGTGRTAVALASGMQHACAILDNGSVSCWGYNNVGQLGDGTTTNRHTPTLISSLGTGRTAALSERDFDADSILNIFEDFICSQGSYQSGSTCIQADTGHFVPNIGQNTQTPCTAGTYQDSTGQSHCHEADAGYYVDVSFGDAQITQTPCPGGTYIPTTGSTSPLDCLGADPGHYVDASAGPGQSNQIPCPAGSYQTLTGQTSCDEADAGFYVELIAQSTQTPCPTGTYNPDYGSANSSACKNADVGYYVELIAQSTQTPCPTGTYNPDYGQPYCTNADPGYYVELIAQSTQTPCPTGTYNPDYGQPYCTNADAGYYVELIAQSTQIPCPVGKYQPLNGQNSCHDADAGYYVELIAQSTQTPCPIGFYQAKIGQGFCDGADAGHYVSSTAQSNQTECFMGTYQVLTEQASCDDANTGFYVDQNGQSNQTVCPIYHSTLNIASQSITDCIQDTDLDSIPDLIDPDDDNDGVIDQSDAFPLDDSKFTDIASDKQVDNSTILSTPEDKTDSNQSSVILVVAGLASVLVCGLVIMKRKKNSHSNAVKELPSTANASSNHIEKPIIIQKPNPSPSIDQVGVIGGDGYEWINFPPNSQTNFYRAPGDKEWILWEN